MRGPTRLDLGELVGPLMIVILTGAVIATFITAIVLTRDGGGDGAVAVEPTSTGTPPPGGTTVEIAMVPTTTFDTETLAIAADTSVTVTADNKDGSQLHNFAVYESQAAFQSGRADAALAATELCTAPCTDTATLELAAGEYFFQCDVHPNNMTGTLTVQ